MNSSSQSKAIVRCFIIYWALLVVWQNILPYSNNSSLTLIVKVFLLLYLIVTLLTNRVVIKKHYFILWIIYLLITFRLLLFKDPINGNTIIYYGYPLIITFLFYFLNSYTVVRIDDFIWFLRSIIIIVSTMALYALFFQTDYLIHFSELTSAYGNELKSFLISSHEYGMYLTYGISSIFIILLQFSISIREKMLLLILAALFFVNMIATLSRTAIVACFVLLVIVIILSNNRRYKQVFLSGMVVFVIVLANNKTLRSFIYTILLKNGNDAGRFTMWNASWEHYMSLPVLDKLFGEGITNVTSYVANTFTHSSMHNAFLQSLFVYGLIGSILLAFIILESIYSSLKLFRINVNYSAIFIALTCSSVAFMFTNTPCLMQSPTDSYFMTMFCIFVPRFVINELSKSSNEVSK